MAIRSKEELKNGEILNALIQRFINEPKMEYFYPILLCLIDSDIIVAMYITISNGDAEMTKDLKDGDELILKNEPKYMPKWLQNLESNKLYLPIFSTTDECPENYSQNATLVSMDIYTAIKFLEENKECSGLVINPFTTSIVLEDSLLQTLKETLKEVRKSEQSQSENNNI